MTKKLVITGGSRGIGLATAKRFHDAEYEVINLSRSASAPSYVTDIPIDFSHPDWVKLSGDQICETVGKPEQLVLIHNASRLVKDDVRAASAGLSEIFQINVIAPQQLTELLLSSMNSGSSIHYVGSTLSEKAVANTLSYVTSKHAILGLMRATTQDLMGTGIHCTCVCPGFTDTEMLRAHVGNDAAVLDSIGSTNSFNRLAKPDEIAETLFFAAMNPVVNGAVLHANLGQRES